MGYLHQGHLSLLRLLDDNCDFKAASIFVNPLQFGAEEDLEKYPRDEERDIGLLSEFGCNLVFIPLPEEIYPPGYQTYVDVETLSQPLCGKYRPGHFRGVATIVMRLFIMTRCSVAAFGLKDYQQAQVIKRLITDLNLPVDLLFGDTVREVDGLALSSRNAYLSPHERKTARLIPQALEWARRECEDDIRESCEILTGMRKILTKSDSLRVQYIDIVNPETLTSVETISGQAQAFVSAFAGKTRLIDNIRIGKDTSIKPNIGSKRIID